MNVFPVILHVLLLLTLTLLFLFFFSFLLFLLFLFDLSLIVFCTKFPADLSVWIDNMSNDENGDANGKLTYLGLAGTMKAPFDWAKGVVSAFQEEGKRVILISDDHPYTVKVFARDVGIITGSEGKRGEDGEWVHGTAICIEGWAFDNQTEDAVWDEYLAYPDGFAAGKVTPEQTKIIM